MYILNFTRVLNRFNRFALNRNKYNIANAIFFHLSKNETKNLLSTGCASHNLHVTRTYIPRV